MRVRDVLSPSKGVSRYSRETREICAKSETPEDILIRQKKKTCITFIACIVIQDINTPASGTGTLRTHLEKEHLTIGTVVKTLSRISGSNSSLSVPDVTLAEVSAAAPGPERQVHVQSAVTILFMMLTVNPR